MPCWLWGVSATLHPARFTTLQTEVPRVRIGCRTWAVSHPWLGVAGRDVTPDLAQQLDLSVPSGVYLVLVQPDSPADGAGLQGAYSSQDEANQSTELASGGDVITKVDGRDVSSIKEVADYINTKQVGDKMEITYVRDGETKTTEATLAQWPS